MKVEVAGLPVSNSLYNFFVCKATFEKDTTSIKAQDLCESRGGRPGLPVSNSLYNFFVCKATFEKDTTSIKPQDLCESRGGRPGLPVCNSLYSLCGRKATFEEDKRVSKLRNCVKVKVAALGSPSKEYPSSGSMRKKR